MHEHHVIVRKVDYENDILELTGFSGYFPEDGRKTKVVTKKIDFADLKDSLYKVEYNKGDIAKKGKQL